MTGFRLGASLAALAAGVAGCAAPTGGGTLSPSSEITPSGPAASLAAIRTPALQPDRLSQSELASHHETLAVQIFRRTALRAAPGGRVLFHVTPRTAFGSQRAMAVLQRRGDWLGVTVEDLANGRLAWVRRDDVHLMRVTWKLRIDLSQRRGWLLHRGVPYRSFSVGVGTATYRTPVGRFGVTDRLAGVPGGPYGCCALALTAHQPNVPQDWPGGDRIALHGTTDPSSVGAESTHGCLRAGDADMRVLIATVPIGTTVVVQE